MFHGRMIPRFALHLTPTKAAVALLLYVAACLLVLVLSGFEKGGGRLPL